MWFTDENVLTAATTRSPQNDRVCCVNRRDVVPERLLRTRWTFSNSLMVSVGVSKLWRTQLILVDPGMKINGTTTVMFFLTQQLLFVVQEISGDDLGRLHLAAIKTLIQRTEHVTQSNFLNRRHPRLLRQTCALQQSG